MFDMYTCCVLLGLLHCYLFVYVICTYLVIQFKCRRQIGWYVYVVLIACTAFVVSGLLFYSHVSHYRKGVVIM
jgi:hypothetical protein